MHSSILLLLFGVVASAIYFITTYIYREYECAAKAKQWGCELPVEAHGGGFLGLKLLKRIQAADSKWLILDLMVDRYNELSEIIGRPATTFRGHILTTHVINTVDPKNIQAMLATQFEDFGLGPTRRGNMMPLLGDGIVRGLMEQTNGIVLTELTVRTRWQGLGTLSCYASAQLCP